MTTTIANLDTAAGGRTAPENAARVIIAEVRPHLGGGRHAIKRVVGERLRVSADILKEGHDTLAAEVRHRALPAGAWRHTPLAFSYEDDEWSAEIPLGPVGLTEYTVAAWTERYASWAEELRRKVGAGVSVASEILEGEALVRACAGRATGDAARRLAAYADSLRAATDGPTAAQIALSPELRELATAAEERDDLTEYRQPLRVIVDRELARFGAWYEIFPRSQGKVPGQGATFIEAIERIPAIKAMGFDILYLCPIHPIGHTNRKGRNNSLVAAPGDVGSPWAIGNQFGGHDAVNPDLGTIDDFDAFVAAARAAGLEIALDIAIQCSPDHPYVREHPEWFRRRPDGTIKYAENPPKKYEDIVALDMWCDDYVNLWHELKRVFLHWLAHGVEIFRIDNPHTKPIAFWEWLIAEVKRDYPGAIFLAEAFTRPKRVQELAKIGFTQSYHYFTWRNTRQELEEYLTDLTQTAQTEYLRPNFFTNTQDILTEYLQTGGRPAFKVRVALAATSSPTYGVYSGFELIENTPLHPGREEYLDSEKYEVRVRDWQAPGNIVGYIRRLNEIRNENPALRLWTNLAFHNADNGAILAYSKVSPDGANRLLVVLNLDPFNAQAAWIRLDGAALGIDEGSYYMMHDLLTDARWPWQGLSGWVRLDPQGEPVHILRLEQY
ncbi:MAG: GH13_3 / GH13 / GH13_38 [uncultured Thermomicrobiales bacterium]|uniref:Alpha-1,4-glucan:maltose-1-phosphate maltosyltransferase n=1 Tax=uncultured Thermomicrobiales bacterium TaxID=1645740 RepID=A0A6J4VDE9_9BACT|nr:MAG: GH13_3 / GH13 / GH13_38 [uncultured Thermomicrobiales bacterium]